MKEKFKNKKVKTQTTHKKERTAEKQRMTLISIGINGKKKTERN